MPRALALALLLQAGCPGNLPDTARYTAGCPDDVPAAILVPKCGSAGCHTATAPAGKLDLVSPGVAGRLLGVTSAGKPELLLIDPLNPDGSVLVRSLTPKPPFGVQQPPGAPLDPAAINCIRAWVRAVIAAGPPAGDAGIGGD
jgi:hypothetical protein